MFLPCTVLLEHLTSLSEVWSYVQSGTPGKPGTGRTSELPGHGVHVGLSP